MTREEQIRPAHLMDAKQSCIEADRAFLLARSDEWVDVNCPGCDSHEPIAFGVKNSFHYSRCCKCGSVYTNPRPSLELLHDFYACSQNYAFWNAHVYPATEQIRREKVILPRVLRVLDYCSRYGIHRGRIAEIGAGFGTFCSEIMSSGKFDECVAIEPTPDLAETCRKRGLNVIESSIEAIADSVKFDVIVAFEVIEHLFDPYDFIHRCRRLLSPGGLLVLSCPNVSGFDVSILGIDSGTFDHEHLNYYNPESLRLLLERGGFGVKIVETPGQLDCDIVRAKVLDGAIDLEKQPFLRRVLVEEWVKYGDVFQSFLADNGLSSHMWVGAVVQV